MVRHNKIENATGTEIISEVKTMIMKYFNLTPEEMVPISLSRLDVKADYLCEPDEEMQIIKNILYKARAGYRFYSKIIQQDNENGFVVKYQTHKKLKSGIEYDVSRQEFKSYTSRIKNVYCKDDDDLDDKDTDNDDLDDTDADDGTGNCVEFAFYDKGQETKYRVNMGKAPIEEILRYRNVFRSEIRFKNAKLNNNQYEKFMPNKYLDTYYKADVTKRLHTKYVSEILGLNDFYRIDIALKKLDESEYAGDMKSKLKSILQLINEEGYTKATNMWLEKYSKPTFYSHIHKIEELGINVLTFDAEIGGQVIHTETIVNFGLIDNSIPEDKININ